MADKIAGIITYSIGVFLMTFFLFVFKRKQTENPALKIYGLPMNTVIKLCYVAIAGFVFLVIGVLLGWTT